MLCHPCSAQTTHLPISPHTLGMSSQRDKRMGQHNEGRKAKEGEEQTEQRESELCCQITLIIATNLYQSAAANSPQAEQSLRL